MALMPSLPDPDKYWSSLSTIPQIMFDWLLNKGVAPLSVGSGINSPLKIAHGNCAADGWFDAEAAGPACFAILVEDSAGPIDVAFWHPRSGRTATLLNYGFALGEHLIENPGVYSFGCHLNIFASPLDWLRSDRDGIFILDWTLAFDLLRYCPAVAVDSSLLATYRAAMQPQRLPDLFVMADAEEAAA
jgi:hypothetical protein